MWKRTISFLLLQIISPLVDENPLLGQSGVLPSNYPNIRIAPPGQAANAFITVPNVSSPGDWPQGGIAVVSEFYHDNDWSITDFMSGFRSTDNGLSWEGGIHILSWMDVRANSLTLAQVDWDDYVYLIVGTADQYVQWAYSNDFGNLWGSDMGDNWGFLFDLSFLGTTPPSGHVRGAYTKSGDVVSFRHSSGAGYYGWDPEVVISNAIPGFGSQRGVSLIDLVGTGQDLLACWTIFDQANRLEQQLRFSHSTNGGVSWAPPSYIFTPGFKGVFGDHKGILHPVRFHSSPSVDVDRMRNTVYVSWTNEIPPVDAAKGGGVEPEPEDRFRPTEVRFTKSTDGGHTWAGYWATVHPASPRTDSWSPKLHVDNGGGVNVLFYDSRKDPASNEETQVYLARSTDQGSSWKNYLISDAWFVPMPVGSSYSACGSALGVSSSDDYLYLTWNDSRTNIQQPYFARFPLRTAVIEDEPFVGWQMLSVPAIREEMARYQVFPGAAVVQKYDNGAYVNIGFDEQLTCTRGYWVKYNSTPPVLRHAGGVSDLMGMYVHTTHGGASWNIIGSLSMPVSTADVIEEPAGLVISQYFRYDNGYVPTTLLVPGEGHYVKTSTNGRLLLKGAYTGDPPLEKTGPSSDVIIVRDARGGSQTLYICAQGESAEMPPDPPEGLFNVRFANGNFVQGLSPSPSLVSIPIHLKSVTYPVTVSWQFAPETAVRYWMRSGARRDSLPRTGSIVINRRIDDLVRLEARYSGLARASDVTVPQASVLRGGYPNPFNPSTELRFELAEASLVSLAVFDLLGRKVADLAAGEYEVGYHSATWNAAGVASGVYMARFTATSATGNVVYTKTHKLVLMK